MGGKSGGGSFVEQGTPLSQEAIASRTNSQNLARQKQEEERSKNRNDGNTGPRGYEGAEVDASTAAAIGAGMIGGLVGAMTGGVPGAVSLGYSAYSSMEDGILGQVTGYGKTDPAQADDRGFFGSLSDVFGSLLGEDDDEGSNGGGFGGGFGNGPGDAGGYGGGFGDGVGTGEGMAA